MSKVIIYTTVYNRPEFIDIQVSTFKKWCRDDYELFILNNANTVKNSELILEKCNKYNLRFLTILKQQDDNEFCSQSHNKALEYALINTIKNNPTDIIVILDNDVFPYKEFSFEKLLNSNLLGGMYQQREIHNYISAIFLMIDGKLDLSKFSFYGGIGDTGAAVQTLMNTYHISPEYINHTAQIDIETDYIFKCKNDIPYDKTYRSQFIGDAFIHFYRGSVWDGAGELYYQQKLKFLLNFLDNPDSYCLNLDDNVNYSTAHSDKSYNGADYNYHNYKFIDMKKPS